MNATLGSFLDREYFRYFERNFEAFRRDYGVRLAQYNAEVVAADEILDRYSGQRGIGMPEYRREIRKSLNFLRRLLVRTDKWIEKLDFELDKYRKVLSREALKAGAQIGYYKIADDFAGGDDLIDKYLSSSSSFKRANDRMYDINLKMNSLFADIETLLAVEIKTIKMDLHDRIMSL